MAIVSIAAVGLTIVVLAGYLIALALILRRVDARMRALIAAMRQVPPRVEPLGPTLETVNLELDRLRDSLQRFGAEKRTES